jgi:hypothetical protein
MFAVEGTDLASRFATQATQLMPLMSPRGAAEKGMRQDRRGREQQQRDSMNEQGRQTAGVGVSGRGGRGRRRWVREMKKETETAPERDREIEGGGENKRGRERQRQREL